MARKKDSDAPAPSPYVIPATEGLFPTDGQVQYPLKDVGPIFLGTCQGCDYHRGLGPFIHVRCAYPSARSIEEAYYERLRRPPASTAPTAPSQPTLF